MRDVGWDKYAKFTREPLQHSDAAFAISSVTLNIGRLRVLG